jgi:hypothetical protein
MHLSPRNFLLVGSIPISIAISCSTPSPVAIDNLRYSFSLPSGQLIVLTEIATKEEILRLGLNLSPGDIACHFRPTHPQGVSGVCIIRGKKLIDYKTTTIYM